MNPETAIEGIEYKKSAVIHVFNDKGELALQLRAAHDDSYPSYWDFSAGGGVDAGEDPTVAARREIQEELGVEADVAFVDRSTHQYQKWNSKRTREEDIHLFTARHNGPFKPDLNEVEKIEFFSIDKIKQMIAAGEKFHPGFLAAWERGINK